MNAHGMNVLGSPCWYAALTLRERAAALGPADAAPPPMAADTAPAQPRLERWRQQLPFGTADLFARRLAAEGLTEETFAHLVGEPVEEVQRRFDTPPAWLDRLAQAFDASAGAATEERAGADGEPSFIEIAAPLMAGGRVRFRQALDELAARCALPFDR